MQRRLQYLFTCILFSFLFFSCQTTSTISKDTNYNDWELIAPGIELLTQKIPEEKLSWTCVKVEINNPDLELYIYPSTKEGSKSVKVDSFSRKKNLITAINTTPFEKNNTLIGITKFDGLEITAPVEKYAALSFCNQNNEISARIIQIQTEEALKDSFAAVGGFFQILKDDQIIPYTNIKRSRSGCGLSQDGKIIYLFAITPDFSLNDHAGFTYEQCSLLFKELGCSDAIMFDGGHSTALAVKGSLVQAPLFQRKVPALFGFILK